MADKIIIDGVDVSECEFFDRGEISDGCSLGYREDPVNNYTPNCQDNNCYYKQLKQVKKENEQLKEIAAKQLIDKGVFINTLDKLRKIIDEKLEKENKLTNALQEIKTLVTKHYIQNKRQLVQNYDCLDNFIQKIEEKCEEVL